MAVSCSKPCMKPQEVRGIIETKVVIEVLVVQDCLTAWVEVDRFDALLLCESVCILEGFEKIERSKDHDSGIESMVMTDCTCDLERATKGDR